MIDWSKVMEVFISGILGVYVIMGLLMVLTQLGLKITEHFENWHKRSVAEPQAEPKQTQS